MGYFDKLENIPCLKTADLKRKGLLKGGLRTAVFQWENIRNGVKARFTVEAEAAIVEDDIDGCATIRYVYTDSKGKETECCHHIKLETTEPYFGGVRHWFRCPIEDDDPDWSCLGRVSILYLKGRYVGCRNCLNLRYRDQFLPGHDKSRKKVIPYGTLLDMGEEISPKFYNGEPTKRFKRYIKQLERTSRVLGEQYTSDQKFAQLTREFLEGLGR